MSLLHLANDEWFEIAQYLSPCDIYRISQINQQFYKEYFSTVQQVSFSFRWFPQLICQQVIDQVENSLLITIQLFSEREHNLYQKIKKEFIFHSRIEWKQLLKIYLKSSYLIKFNTGDFLVYFPSRIFEGNELKLTRDLFLNNDEYRDEDDELVLIHGYKQGETNYYIFSKESVINTIRKDENQIIIPELIDVKLAHLDSPHSIVRKLVLQLWENTNLQRLYHSLDMIVKQEVIYPNRKISFHVKRLDRMQKKVVMNFPEMGFYSAQVNLQIRPFMMSYSFSNENLWNSFKILARKSAIMAAIITYVFIRTSYSYSWFACTIRSINSIYYSSDFSLVQMIFYSMIYFLIFIIGGKHEQTISLFSFGYFALEYVGKIEESQSDIIQVVNASFEIIHIVYLVKIFVKHIFQEGGLVRRCKFWIHSVLDKLLQD